MTTHAVEVLLPAEGPALVLPAEQAYVTETATGLTFRPDTPMELLEALIVRLARQEKRIQWALGDALNFAERRYGDTYTAWVEQTGLSENTLATIKWVAGKIESSRRREDVGWSHHREAAGLDDPEAQDAVLERAADKGMTRWEVRKAVQAEQEAIRGHAVRANGEPVETPDLWAPDISELTEDARFLLESRAPANGRHRAVYVAAWLACLVATDQQDAFTVWRGPQ